MKNVCKRKRRKKRVILTVSMVKIVIMLRMEEIVLFGIQIQAKNNFRKVRGKRF